MSASCSLVNATRRVTRRVAGAVLTSGARVRSTWQPLIGCHRSVVKVHGSRDTCRSMVGRTRMTCNLPGAALTHGPRTGLL